MTAANSKALQERAGITPRQMDHWYRAGYLEPFDRSNLGSGTPMVWPERTLKKAVLMGRLTRAGFIPKRAHELADLTLNAEGVEVVGLNYTARGIWLDKGIWLEVALI